MTEEILRRNEFRPPRRSLLQAVWHWITTGLGHLLGRLFGAGAGSGWASYAVVAVVAAVVVALVWLTIVRRGPGGRRSGRPVVAVRGHSAPRLPGEWRAEAAEHDAAGRWRQALRCRYRALIAELAGWGVVEEIPGRTSGEYRRDVGAAVPDASSAFDVATDLFEEAWYGDRPIGPNDQASFDDLAQRVLSSQRGSPLTAATR